VITFEVSGEFDLAMVPRAREELLELISANPGETISIDLSQVSFMDSSALGLLAGAQKRAQRTDVDLVLHAPRPSVWRVITVTGIDRVFECTDTPS
jgi:anti-sigma B factor antagonist